MVSPVLFGGHHMASVVVTKPSMARLVTCRWDP